MPLSPYRDPSKPVETGLGGKLVSVSAPARLHLGFLDLHGGLGRKFGSIGLAIDQPATKLTLQRAPADLVKGFEPRRARHMLERFKALLNLDGCYRLNVDSSIPSHAGLGSGTQLAMAVGAGLAALEGVETEVRALGEMQNRGARSAIGMAAFEHGGFVVDGGRGGRETAAPIIARASFPSAWRVLLVLDPDCVGVHGEGEIAAFETLAAMQEAVSAEMCRVTLMQLLPALAELDIEAFGAAVGVVQRLNGEYFASAQGGGIWSSHGVARLVKRMAELGAVGIGQSSWGPTGFAFVPSQTQAARILDAIEGEAVEAGVRVVIARGRNQGSSVDCVVADQLSATSG
jgi:beta-ribofuranosylaminobenzene 5'-phosphate synthase